MKSLNVFVALVVVHIAGCGSTVERPTAQLAAAETVLTLAEQNGAEQYSLEQLTIAREKLSRAKQSESDERFTEARNLAAEAEVDARLAASLQRWLKPSWLLKNLMQRSRHWKQKSMWLSSQWRKTKLELSVNTHITWNRS